MAIDSGFYKNKQKTGIYISIVFLVLVILVTAGMFLYNQKLETQIAQTDEQITERNNAIAERKKDPNIESYDLYELNKDTLDSMAERSDIPAFVEHALRTMVKYDLVFQDFNYNGGDISINAFAESNDKGLAYSKIVKFLNEYNKNESSLFILEQVENFTGQNEIQFPVTFTLK